MGLVPLQKRPEGACLPLLPCEDVVSQVPFQKQSEPLPDTQSADALILDFPAPKTEQ
jgi:hypothetical protein